MWEILLWIYLVNAVLVILHEMDSVYWKEWELFKLPGGFTGFLLIHFPLFLLVLYGAVLVHARTQAGLVLSLVLAAGGIAAFAIHTAFLLKGRREFKTPLSLSILGCTLTVSLAQVGVTTCLFRTA
jgi:hypothetical protein